MGLDEKQLNQARKNLEVVSQLLSDRPEEVFAIIFELLYSDEAYDAAFWPPDMRIRRRDKAIESLQITSAQLSLLTACLGSAT